MFVQIALVGLVGAVVWIYQAIKPAPSKICGSPKGPPVTATRVKLRDGRYLAYKEMGVPKEKAKHKIVYVHGFDQCRHDAMPVPRVTSFLFFLPPSFSFFSFSSFQPSPPLTFI